MCWTPLYQTKTNNTNKTRALLPTTGGKDQHRFMQKSQRISQHGTQNIKTHNRTTQKNPKKMSNTDPTKTWVNSGAHEY